MNLIDIYQGVLGTWKGLLRVLGVGVLGLRVPVVGALGPYRALMRPLVYVERAAALWDA